MHEKNEYDIQPKIDDISPKIPKKNEHTLNLWLYQIKSMIFIKNHRNNLYLNIYKMYTILSISDSDKHFSSAILEYQKRLWKDLKIQNIKPTKHWTQTQIIKQDTANITNILKKSFSNHKKIMLSKQWNALDTQELRQLCNKYLNTNNNIVFIIWGAYWLDEPMFRNMTKLSFGRITIPHGLAKLVLIEQIYRIYTLNINKKYHY